MRAVSPIRLYLICSLLFFGAMSLGPARRQYHVSVTPSADPQLAHLLHGWWVSSRW